LVATEISNLTLDATPATSDQLAIERGGTSNFRTSVANLLAVSHNHSATEITTGTLAVARGGTGVISSTGTVAVVLSTSPTLITPTTNDLTFTGREKLDKGADVASGGTVTLGGDGNVFDITGTTTIDEITPTSWQAGSIVYLQFDGILTVTHNSGGTNDILLGDQGDMTTAAGDTLTLFFNGTDWVEVSRSVVGGGFWVEAGRTTLGSAGTSLSVSATFKKYYKFEIFSPDGDTRVINLRFNTDSAANYVEGQETSGGSMVKATGQTEINLSNVTRTGVIIIKGWGVNVAAEEKLILSDSNSSTVGDVTTFSSARTTSKWRNVADLITSLDLVSTGNMAIGTEMVVSHHD